MMNWDKTESPNDNRQHKENFTLAYPVFHTIWEMFRSRIESESAKDT